MIALAASDETVQNNREHMCDILQLQCSWCCASGTDHAIIGAFDGADADLGHASGGANGSSGGGGGSTHTGTFPPVAAADEPSSAGDNSSSAHAHEHSGEPSAPQTPPHEAVDFADCSECDRSFCIDCIVRNFGSDAYGQIVYMKPSAAGDNSGSAHERGYWKCYHCNPAMLEGHQHNCRQVKDWPADPDQADAKLDPHAVADLLGEITKTMCSIEAQLESVGIQQMRSDIASQMESSCGSSGAGAGAGAGTGAPADAERREAAVAAELETWEADLDQLHTRLSTQAMIIEELYVYADACVC